MARTDHDRMFVRTPNPMAPCRSHGTLTIIHEQFPCLTYKKPPPTLQSFPEDPNVALYPTCLNTDTTQEDVGVHLSFSELGTELVSVD